jgi:hypothetical protein
MCLVKKANSLEVIGKVKQWANDAGFGIIIGSVGMAIACL